MGPDPHASCQKNHRACRASYAVNGSEAPSAHAVLLIRGHHSRSGVIAEAPKESLDWSNACDGSAVAIHR